MKMRAKMKVTSVKLFEKHEQLIMSPVIKSGYPESGLDEDNTYAKFTPGGEVDLVISNPGLFGKFKPGQVFYLDFTEVVPV